MANPENREAPNKSEVKPKTTSVDTAKKLGNTAIKGANKSK